MASFAQRFKYLRDDVKGWTQDDAAEALGVSRSTIAGYESEAKNRIPRKETLDKICDVFGVSIDYLLGRTDDPKPSKDNKPQINRGFHKLPENMTDEEADFLNLQLEIFRKLKGGKK